MTVVRTNTPVTYQWWEPYYDRALDFVQLTWQRFADSGVGSRTVHVLPRVCWVVLLATWRLFRLSLKVALWILGATMVVGFGVLYTCLMFALGAGKVGKR